MAMTLTLAELDELTRLLAAETNAEDARPESEKRHTWDRRQMSEPLSICVLCRSFQRGTCCCDWDD